MVPLDFVPANPLGWVFIKFWIVSLHPRAHWYSDNYSKNILWNSPELFLWVILFSLILGPAICSFIDLSRLPASSLVRKTLRLHLGFSPLKLSLKTIDCSNYQAHLICFPYPQYRCSSLPDSNASRTFFFSDFFSLLFQARVLIQCQLFHLDQMWNSPIFHYEPNL